MVTVRPATEVDLDYLLDSGESEKYFSIGENCFWSEDQLRRLITDDLVLVAGNQEGYIIATIQPSTKKAIIENIYVNPETRREGLASVLLEECVTELNSRGASNICAMVDQNNVNAVNLFEKHNFSKNAFYWMGVDFEN